MERSEVVEIEGRPRGFFLLSVALGLTFVVLLGEFLKNSLSNRNVRAADMIVLAGSAILTLALAVYSWKLSSKHRGTVLMIGPDGFRDKRLADTLIPWTAVKKLKFAKVGRHSGVRVDFTPAFETTEAYRSADLAWVVRTRRFLGWRSVWVSTQRLSVTPVELASLMVGYRGDAIVRMTPAERDAIEVAEAVDPTLVKLRAMEGTRPYFTFALLAALIAIFAVEATLASAPGRAGSPGSALTPRDLVLDGGLIRLLVDNGQWWRFFSGPLLHGSFFHLLANGIALIFSGYLLERLIGWRWYGAIFAFAALTGAIASYAFNPTNMVSVGASGGIVGLFAASLILAWHYQAGAIRTAMLMGAVRVLLPTLIPRSGGHGAGTLNIDVAAHIGGAVGGAMIGLLILRVWNKDHDVPKSAVFPAVLTAAFLIGSTAAFALAAQYRSVVAAIDPFLPQAFALQVKQSAALIAKYPRDPRIRYARAAALYDGNQNADARLLLEGILSDPTMLQMTPKMETPTRVLLGEIDEADGKHDLAKAIVSPICETKDAATRERIKDLCD